MLAPILLLLVFGVIDLGRGFYYQTQTTDAARDGARLLIGYAPDGSAGDADADPTCAEGNTCDSDDAIGPGFDAVCDHIQRDLANVAFASPACLQVLTPPNTTPPGFVACDGEHRGCPAVRHGDGRYHVTIQVVKIRLRSGLRFG